ncbi:MAG TPA: hypothetical protein VFM98_06145 [Ramlibacter sp.]|uniref:hypothetical protein n=1 Tax=Ramlibacter sp. TaxID=1917967 RepID=UPI002D80A02D|nr:hypothetical protein [Ramlibacter sp.]HET8745163.1 hypothetical protein [Ramlibacter sp.]
MKHLFNVAAIFAAGLLANAAFASQQPSLSELALSAGGVQPTVLAREAESGDDHGGRGRGPDDGKGHRLSDDAGTSTIAREAESGDDHGGRGRGRDDGKGHRLSDDAGTSTIARETEAGDDHGGRGRGRDDGKGHRLSDDAGAGSIA